MDLFSVTLTHPEHGEFLTHFGGDRVPRVSIRLLYTMTGVATDDIDPGITNDADHDLWLVYWGRRFAKDIPIHSRWVIDVRGDDGDLLIDTYLMNVFFQLLGASKVISEEQTQEGVQFAAWFASQASIVFSRRQWGRLFAPLSPENLAKWRAEHPPAKKWVYFFHDADAGWVKIGISGNVKQRLRGMVSGYGKPLAVLGVIPDADERLETETHMRFKHLRQLGEWFIAGEDLLEYVRANAVPFPA